MPEKKTKLAELLTVGVVLVLFAALAVTNLFYVAPEISKSERRTLATRPDILVEKGGEATLNADFMDDFETYALDSFVLRDTFRSLKARVLKNVLLQKDNNGIYIVNGNAAKLEQLDEASVQQVAQKMNTVRAMLPETAQVYYSVIADKGAYLGPENGYPGIDYTRVEELLGDALPDMTYISIRDALSADAYYKTDLHWNQTALGGVLDALGEAMGFSDRLTRDYVPHTLSSFYGVYAGQAALPLAPDTLTYQTSPAIDAADVWLLNTTTVALEPSEMYVPERFDGVDPYDVFLSGAQPLVVIENPAAQTERALYLFRDSFSSSLAPLLTSAYSKITLIDLRYISAPLMAELVTFEPDADVLFLYGVQVLNSGSVLLVS